MLELNIFNLENLRKYLDLGTLSLLLHNFGKN